MWKPINHNYRLICLILALLGVVSGAALPDHLWRHRAFAQAAVSQAPNPGWSFTDSLSTARSWHTATLLHNGKVLVAGGETGCPFTLNYLNSTELYDPATGTWSYSGTLGTPRSGHSATLLPNGKVLVAGGMFESDNPTYTAELYDPATGTWSYTGNLNTVHSYHVATLLANGKVLVLGGEVDFYSSTPEIYDPATEKWSRITDFNSTGALNTATLLTNGRVLVVRANYANPPVSASAELFDPDKGTWSTTGRLSSIHSPKNATLLRNGKVLVTGRDTNRLYAEIYDPESGTWSSTGAPKIGEGIAVLLPDGKVLAGSGSYSELYYPSTGRWGSTTNFNPPQSINTATLLSNGNVLFTIESRCGPGSNSAALFDYRLAPSGTVSNVSAASYSLWGLASEAIAVAFDTGLATASSAANILPLPTQLAGTSVKIRDSAGIERPAPLFFVSPTQVNYQIPLGTATGPAWVTITSGDGAVSGGAAIIQTVAPSLFTANATGEGVAAGLALRVKVDGSRSYEPIAQFDTAQNKFVARPIDLGPEGEQVYLLLFGTGIRNRSSLSSVKAWIRSMPYEVSFAGAQGDFTGLDQINLLVPRNLVGRGEVDVLLTVEKQMANIVRVQID